MTKRRFAAEPRKYWTREEDARLRAEYPNHRTEELVALFPGRTLRSIYGHAKDLGVKKSAAFLASPEAHRLNGVVGTATRFKRQQPAWNKGLSYDAGGRSHETRFKKGQTSHTKMPVGSITKSSDGYWKVKVGEPRQWRWCHRMAWEQAHGPIPPGLCLVFKDGNPDDYSLANLELVPRQALMLRNSVHNLPAELVSVIQLRGALNRKINQRQERAREEQA